MAYSWFRAESAAVDHPKVMELAVMLKVELPLADGYLFRLWSWVQRYAPRGTFSARVVPQLEAYIGRAGVIEVMRAVGLLDASVGADSVEFCVHDWDEMQGALVEKSERDARLRHKSRRHSAARRKRGDAKTPRGENAQTNRTGQDITNRTDETREEAGAPRPADLFEVWNKTTVGELPQALELNVGRTTAARARLKERPDLAQWRAIVERINASDFCRGQNDRGWVATFDWLLQPDTAAKVLEGKYDNRGKPQPQRDKPVEYTTGLVQWGSP